MDIAEADIGFITAAERHRALRVRERPLEFAQTQKCDATVDIRPSFQAADDKNARASIDQLRRRQSRRRASLTCDHLVSEKDCGETQRRSQGRANNESVEGHEPKSPELLRAISSMSRLETKWPT
ncbi:hypothetical protein MSC49_25230 [Methylosinus sp. C49]|nr:hypothetical protein MSC49_25230 [Methylosinus sp. C49]